MGAKELEDGIARQCADELVDGATALEQSHVGDRANRELRRQPGIRGAVDLGQCDGTIELLDDTLQLGAEHATRAAPRGPEVDQHRHLARALDNPFVEIELRYVGYTISHSHGPNVSPTAPWR